MIIRHNIEIRVVLIDQFSLDFWRDHKPLLLTKYAAYESFFNYFLI